MSLPLVTQSELGELCELVQDITGTRFTKYGDAVGGATAMFSSAVPTFVDKNVCPTGKFISGTRSGITRQIEALGGRPQVGVTNKTDILVIGSLCSRDWIHSSTGRKIEKAIALKKTGQEIIMTNERVAFLNGAD